MNGTAVPSPCIGVCKLDEQTGWCYGCRRTLEEVAEWPRMTDSQKREVLKALKERSFDG